MTESTIKVCWKKAPTSSDVPSWHTWQFSPQNHPLDEKLGWPEGSISVLEEAFRLKLSRFTGWDLTKLPRSEAAQQAARVFKRSVFTKPKAPEGETSGTYPIHFRKNEPASALRKFSDYFWVVDANVWRLWPQLHGISKSVCVLELSEKSKTLTSVAHLLGAANSSEHKNKPWLIIGGGIVGDTAAFAASLLQRPFTLVPTTLLAMVDACVGGKTGVNFPPYGKNQVGLFAFPEAVEVIPSCLTTLSEREYRAGLAECLKHAMLSGQRNLWDRLVNNGTPLSAEEIVPLIAVKADIVAEDPFEHGKRAVLNLGHTLGHALEGISQERKSDHDDMLHHGEAVTLGIYFALILSEELGGREDMSPYRKDLRYSGCLLSRDVLEQALDCKLSDHRLWSDIENFLAQDKKATHETRWILMQGFGEIWRENQEWTVPVPQDILLRAWRRFMKELT